MFSFFIINFGHFKMIGQFATLFPSLSLKSLHFGVRMLDGGKICRWLSVRWLNGRIYAYSFLAVIQSSRLSLKVDFLEDLNGKVGKVFESKKAWRSTTKGK